jgi:probable phosphoglycerate mutase
MEGARRVPGWTPVDFFILRHGQTTWNARGIIQGQADAPLDDVGRAQARALAEFLVGDGLSAGRTRGFPRPGLPVVTSDLSRAVDTARVLADALVRARAEDDARFLRVPSDPSAEPEPLHQTPKLRERHVGRLQGLKRADAKTSDPVAWRAFRSRDDSQRIPGEKGESYDNLWDRAVGFVEARAAAAAAAAAAVPADASRLAAADAEGRARAPIALVTHGGVARVLLDRCARDEAALRRAFEGVQSGAVPTAVSSKTETTETETDEKGGGVARRPGVVPNCSVGVIRVHVPPASAESASREQMWEAVVWGEDAFLAAAGGGAESTAGEDYA